MSGDRTHACWEWPTDGRVTDGRATTAKGRYVYRVLYELAVRALEPDEVLHHECGHPWCVNPYHLTPMTQGEHLRLHDLPGDWGQAAKTHCPQGHPYDGANTYVYVRKNGLRPRRQVVDQEGVDRRPRRRSGRRRLHRIVLPGRLRGA